jgi:TRAP-type C4-dicarboxylate transport system permease small subunit
MVGSINTKISGSVLANGFTASIVLTLRILAFRLMNFLLKIVTWLSKGCACLVSGLLCLVLFMVSIDSIGRYFLGSPIPGTLELSESVIVMIIFLTIPFCEMTSGHIRVTFIIERMPAKIRMWLKKITNIMAIVYFSILCWRSWLIAWYSWSIRETSWGSYPIPLYPAKFSVSVGSGIMAIYLLLILIASFLGTNSEPPASSEESK